MLDIFISKLIRILQYDRIYWILMEIIRFQLFIVFRVFFSRFSTIIKLHLFLLRLCAVFGGLFCAKYNRKIYSLEAVFVLFCLTNINGSLFIEKTSSAYLSFLIQMISGSFVFFVDQKPVNQANSNSK